MKLRVFQVIRFTQRSSSHSKIGLLLYSLNIFQHHWEAAVLCQNLETLEKNERRKSIRKYFLNCNLKYWTIKRFDICFYSSSFLSFYATKMDSLADSLRFESQIFKLFVCLNQAEFGPGMRYKRPRGANWSSWLQLPHKKVYALVEITGTDVGFQVQFNHITRSWLNMWPESETVS